MNDRPGHILSLPIHFAVFAALMVLLAATVLAAQVNLGWVNDVIMIAIAGAKAMLVVLYFMHVRYSSRMTWVFAAAGLLWLITLIGLTLSDYLSRGWTLQ
jgi:cytochrome c oxidase subunit 4